MDMDIEAHRDLKLLEAVEQDSRVTQRSLAQQARHRARPDEHLSEAARPQGLHQVRERAVEPDQLPDHAARHRRKSAPRPTSSWTTRCTCTAKCGSTCADVLQDCAAADRRVAIYGRGEAAELAYLSLKEFGLEPVAIFDVDSGTEFLGMPVLAISGHGQVNYDLMIVATLERSGQQLASLVGDGVPREKLVPLRQEQLPRRRPAPELARTGTGQDG